jgi:hypothetical protein
MSLENALKTKPLTVSHNDQVEWAMMFIHLLTQTIFVELK